MTRITATDRQIARRLYSLRALGRPRSDLLLENVALRQPVNALIQTKPLPRLPAEERILWVALRGAWSGWRDALLLVQPETVLAWHRNAYRRYWTALARAGPVEAGRGGSQADRPDGELLKLDFDVSERTVSRHLPWIRPGRGTIRQWGTFLRNHREALAARTS